MVVGSCDVVWIVRVAVYWGMVLVHVSYAVCKCAVSVLAYSEEVKPGVNVHGLKDRCPIGPAGISNTAKVRDSGSYRKMSLS